MIKMAMHTYEYICKQCPCKITMEIHKAVDYNLVCPCGTEMTLVFYLNSPDTRAELDHI